MPKMHAHAQMQNSNEGSQNPLYQRLPTPSQPPPLKPSSARDPGAECEDPRSVHGLYPQVALTREPPVPSASYHDPQYGAQRVQYDARGGGQHQGGRPGAYYEHDRQTAYGGRETEQYRDNSSYKGEQQQQAEQRHPPNFEGQQWQGRESQYGQPRGGGGGGGGYNPPPRRQRGERATREQQHQYPNQPSPSAYNASHRDTYPQSYFHDDRDQRQHYDTRDHVGRGGYNPPPRRQRGERATREQQHQYHGPDDRHNLHDDYHRHDPQRDPGARGGSEGRRDYSEDYRRGDQRSGVRGRDSNREHYEGYRGDFGGRNNRDDYDHDRYDQSYRDHGDDRSHIKQDISDRGGGRAGQSGTNVIGYISGKPVEANDPQVFPSRQVMPQMSSEPSSPTHPVGGSRSGVADGGYVPPPKRRDRNPPRPLSPEQQVLPAMGLEPVNMPGRKRNQKERPLMNVAQRQLAATRLAEQRLAARQRHEENAHRAREREEVLAEESIGHDRSNRVAATGGDGGTLTQNAVVSHSASQDGHTQSAQPSAREQEERDLAAVAQLEVQLMDEKQQTLVTQFRYVIEAGDMETVTQMLVDNPELALDIHPKNNQSPLHYATQVDDEGLTELLLDCIDSTNIRAGQKATILNLPDSQASQTALHYAAIQNASAVARLLIAAGASLNVKDVRGQTPLHCAAEKASMFAAKALIDAGAEVNAHNKDLAWTPLHHVAEHDAPEIAAMLVDAGANVNALDKYRETPLHVGSKHGSAWVVKILLDACADEDAMDAEGRTPRRLSSAAHPTVSAMLADPELRREQRARLQSAMNERDPKCIGEVIVDHPDLVHYRDRLKCNQTPLHYAVEHKMVDLVKLLIKHLTKKGIVQVNAHDAHGRTPLLLAASQGDEELAMLLLANGGRVLFRDEFKLTALHHAAEQNCVDLCKSLLQADAAVNARNRWKETPLHLAARSDAAEATTLLLQFRAKVFRKDEDDQTAFDVAPRDGPVKQILALGMSTGSKFAEDNASSVCGSSQTGSGGSAGFGAESSGDGSVEDTGSNAGGGVSNSKPDGHSSHAAAFFDDESLCSLQRAPAETSSTLQGILTPPPPKMRPSRITGVRVANGAQQSPSANSWGTSRPSPGIITNILNGSGARYLKEEQVAAALRSAEPFPLQGISSEPSAAIPLNAAAVEANFADVPIEVRSKLEELLADAADTRGHSHRNRRSSMKSWSCEVCTLINLPGPIGARCAACKSIRDDLPTLQDAPTEVASGGRDAVTESSTPLPRSTSMITTASPVQSAPVSREVSDSLSDLGASVGTTCDDDGCTPGAARSSNRSVPSYHSNETTSPTAVRRSTSGVTAARLSAPPDYRSWVCTHCGCINNPADEICSRCSMHIDDGFVEDGCVPGAAKSSNSSVPGYSKEMTSPTLVLSENEYNLTGDAHCSTVKMLAAKKERDQSTKETGSGGGNGARGVDADGAGAEDAITPVATVTNPGFVLSGIEEEEIGADGVVMKNESGRPQQANRASSLALPFPEGPVRSSTKSSSEILFEPANPDYYQSPTPEMAKSLEMPSSEDPKHKSPKKPLKALKKVKQVFGRLLPHKKPKKKLSAEDARIVVTKRSMVNMGKHEGHLELFPDAGATFMERFAAMQAAGHVRDHTPADDVDDDNESVASSGIQNFGRRPSNEPEEIGRAISDHTNC